MEEHPDRIAEVFKDKTVFITGGTGFMGKALLEIILRCTEPRKIYLLIRPKKDRQPQERIKDVLQNPLFEPLLKLKGEHVADKLEAISGEITLPGLGISEEDRRKLTEEVDMIYHSAASIRFDEPLKVAVDMNVRGTKFMLELAKECKRLMIFLHFSTAYCHLEQEVLYDKVYPPPMDPNLVLDIVDTMDEDMVCQLTPKIMGSSHNTYVFTKALAEGLVGEEMDNLPVVIVRPSIVIPIWLEPVPGWTDNLNGPAGVILTAGKGLLRSFYCDSNGYADFLPVDIGVNNVMLITYVFLKGRTTRVYNLTTSSEFQFSYEYILDMARDIMEEEPSIKIVWYPDGSMKKNRLYHKVSVLLFQVIPALFVDALLFVLGFRPVLLYVQRRLLKGLDMIEYFLNNQWDFKSDERIAIRSIQNPTEKLIYRLHGDGLDVRQYFMNCARFGKMYFLKETDDILPAAKRNLKLMWFLDRFCKTMFFLGLIYYIWTKYFYFFN